MRNKQKGFSLIELLIVVAIILIIAAIAIPNLIRSRMAANEASAVASLRTLTTAFVTYSTTYGNGLPPTLNALKNPAVGTSPALQRSRRAATRSPSLGLTHSRWPRQVSVALLLDLAPAQPVRYRSPSAARVSVVS
jgi:prepilin-type N-terminal cleavage/methylation domain-containing protein